MTIYMFKIAVVVWVLLASYVSAFSSGAGSCGAGDTSILNTVAGNIHTTSGNGPLADAGVTFSINGIALSAGTAASFPVGTDLDWSVDSATTAFKGIFIRVQAEGEFTHVGDPALVDVATTCAGISGVQGLDHFSSAAKTSVTGTDNFAAAGTATVDIVVVFSSALFAFSSFSLTLEQVAAPTGTPTGTPVAAPVAAPTGTPTGTPLAVPVVAPTDTPVAVPVVAPTDTPVAAPVAAPTETPVAVPVETPVDVPIEAPSGTPEPTPLAVTSEPTPSPLAVTPEPTPALPVVVPTKAPKAAKGMDMNMKDKDKDKAGKGMDMKMKDKDKDEDEDKDKKKGMAAKSENMKDDKKDKKGMMKRHNLRY